MYVIIQKNQKEIGIPNGQPTTICSERIAQIRYFLRVGTCVSKTSIEEVKDHESIQSSTTPDPGHLMGT